MDQIELKRRLFGFDIHAQVTRLENGIAVLLAGGEKGHIGAVSIAETSDTEVSDTKVTDTEDSKSSGAVCQTIAFPGHREDVLSEKWAKAIAGKKKCRAVVLAGIHYDKATKEQIQEILRVTDEMLAEILCRE